MIIYTEKQQLIAYASHVWDIAQTNEANPSIPLELTTLEEFRLIYEETWAERYGDMME